ncbi:MAG TPA: response regulator transcription factor [Polyangiaceae bacterium]|nr:response regulator transcription factor [Polyangiaceae bacterium]
MSGGSGAISNRGTVLLVDDEPDTRELLAGAIERAGYRCVTALDAPEALERATAEGAVDVVVTDVVLGAEDRAGLRLMMDLRAMGVHAPVIVITAYADVEKVKIALNQGAVYLIEKPFRAPELIQVIDRVRAQGVDVRPSVAQVLGGTNLTDKERVVARHLLEGLSYAEIAELESNSTNTIRQHVSTIYAKLGVGNRAELFRLVYAR